MGFGHHHHHHSHSHSEPCGDHDHHGHPHGHGVQKRLWLAFALNAGFALIELVGGILTNSMAVLSDALHDFGDAMAIGLAIVLERVSRQASNGRYTYGYRRFSTVSALITGGILILGSALILIQSVPRLISPQAPHAIGMIGLALLGLAVNGFAAWRVSKGQSLSEKMIVWHLLEDVLGWALVLVGAIIMHFFGLPQIDAALACLLAIWILFNVSRNLNSVFQVFLQAAPLTLDLAQIEEALSQLKGVEGVHHSHLWSMDGEKHVFTSHVVLSANSALSEVETLKAEAKALLKKMGIWEATLEFELSSQACADPHKD